MTRKSQEKQQKVKDNKKVFDITEETTVVFLGKQLD